MNWNTCNYSFTFPERFFGVVFSATACVRTQWIFLFPLFPVHWIGALLSQQGRKSSRGSSQHLFVTFRADYPFGNVSTRKKNRIQINRKFPWINSGRKKLPKKKLQIKEILSWNIIVQTLPSNDAVGKLCAVEPKRPGKKSRVTRNCFHKLLPQTWWIVYFVSQLIPRATFVGVWRGLGDFMEFGELALCHRSTYRRDHILLSEQVAAALAVS